eukprot:357500-Chlamydomonas_euryale.AAC.4
MCSGWTVPRMPARVWLDHASCARMCAGWTMPRMPACLLAWHACFPADGSHFSCMRPCTHACTHACLNDSMTHGLPSPQTACAHAAHGLQSCA